MRTKSVILITILLIYLSFGQLWAQSDTEKIAISDAQAWLSLIDSGDYASSWSEASTFFREAVTEQNWASSLKAVRKPLGKLVHRNMVKAQVETSLPGAPDGRYVVLSFETAFEQKKSAIETVTFMLDKDKKWRATGYFIK